MRDTPPSPPSPVPRPPKRVAHGLVQFEGEGMVLGGEIPGDAQANERTMLHVPPQVGVKVQCYRLNQAPPFLLPDPPCAVAVTATATHAAFIFLAVTVTVTVTVTATVTANKTTPQTLPDPLPCGGVKVRPPRLSLLPFTSPSSPSFPAAPSTMGTVKR